MVFQSRRRCKKLVVFNQLQVLACFKVIQIPINIVFNGSRDVFAISDLKSRIETSLLTSLLSNYW